MALGVVDGYLGAEVWSESAWVYRERGAGVCAEGYAVIMSPFGGWRRGLLVDGA